MKNVGRNEPCPCGSGKKYKHCHAKIEQKNGTRNWTYAIVGLIILFIIAAVANFLIDYKNAGNTTGNSPSNSSTVTKPEGPAPAGKVWSEEHGHYH